MTAEEKRSLLNMTELWAKKTMENSSTEGSTHIRNDLRSLQLEWDTLMTSISSRRASLESVMLRWSDLDKDIAQVQRWMLDVKRHLLNTEPKSDLSEKTAHLQRTKVTYFPKFTFRYAMSLLDMEQLCKQCGMFLTFSNDIVLYFQGIFQKFSSQELVIAQLRGKAMNLMSTDSTHSVSAQASKNICEEYDQLKQKLEVFKILCNERLKMCAYLV